MENNGKRNGKTAWLAIGIPLMAAVTAVLGFFYGIGQRGGKITEVVDWKAETAPRIERMDAVGTNSFKTFHDEYLRTQARQEAKLQELEARIYDKQIDDLRERLKTLERNKP